MADWTKLLKADPTSWLLEESNPSVRYLTLVHILDRKETSAEVKRAKADILRAGVVPRILSRQNKGSWNGPGRFYRDKYKGTVWQLLMLAEHEADGANRKIAAACEYILRCSQDPESHGFSYDQRADETGGRHGEVIPCLTGNMVWSLVKLGFLGDERVRKGIGWITRYQRFDDGATEKPAGWPYDRYEMCWGRHSCHLGVVKALKALSAIPKRQRNVGINRSIANACEYLLAHHIYKRSHDLSKVSKPGWLRLQFPLMYQTDILEIADILVDLGIRDERMSDALELIRSKQDEQGRWRLESSLNGRFWASIERKGMPSKWITYRAIKVLKRISE
ncbi:MAG: nitrogen fixation protein NifH [Spirochaetes bacterium]|nr:nitrogen fixation protein NifH [Spirochaetota bacterium]